MQLDLKYFDINQSINWLCLDENIIYVSIIIDVVQTNKVDHIKNKKCFEPYGIV